MWTSSGCVTRGSFDGRSSAAGFHLKSFCRQARQSPPCPPFGEEKHSGSRRCRKRDHTCAVRARSSRRRYSIPWKLLGELEGARRDSLLDGRQMLSGATKIYFLGCSLQRRSIANTLKHEIVLDCATALGMMPALRNLRIAHLQRSPRIRSDLPSIP